MSRLDELIQELCPEGIKNIPMGSLMTRVYERGKDAPNIKQVYAVSNTLGMVSAEEYRENTIHSEDTSNYTVVREGMVAYNPSRLNIGSIAMLKSSLPGLVSPMYIVFSIDEEKVCRQYFDYLMHSTYVANKIDSFKEEGARFRFDYLRWNWIMIQIPPKQIQEKIVRVLNCFTELITKLTAELETRQKQYKYYAKQLFDSAKGVIPTTLEVISENCDYMRKPVTSGKRETGDIPYYGASGVVDYVKDYIFDGDYLLISEDGANLIARSTPIAFSITGKTWVNNHAHVLKFKSMTTQKYVERYLNMLDLTPFITGAAQPKLNQKNLNMIQIPLPPMEEQIRIMDILNKFDTITTDNTNGLPAEINARKKQYEYYRDKLLLFNQPEVFQ